MSNKRIRRKQTKRALEGLDGRIRRLTPGVPIDHDEPIDGPTALAFDDLLAAMQTPEHRAATDRALQATGEEMGRAAVEAAFDAALRAVGEGIARGPAASMSEAELIAAADAAKRAVRKGRPG